MPLHRHVVYENTQYSLLLYFSAIQNWSYNTAEPLQRGKTYILVEVTGIAETCIGLPEIKEIIGTNTQSEAFQETLQQCIFFQLFFSST